MGARLLTEGGGCVYSDGGVWATPLWQSMQVAAPPITFSCIGFTKSFCFATTSGVNAWQMRQLRESLALVFGPDVLRHAQALLLELFLGGYYAAQLPDHVLDPGLRLVPEQFRVMWRDVAIVARGAHAGAIHAMHARAVPRHSV